MTFEPPKFGLARFLLDFKGKAAWAEIAWTTQAIRSRQHQSIRFGFFKFVFLLHNLFISNRVNCTSGELMKQPALISRLMGKPLGLTVLTAALVVAAAMPASAQEKVLRIGMTAADIPRTLGQPDQGFEGNRFTGIPMYDALTQWDLSKSDVPSTVIAGLATSWAVDANDKKKMGFQAAPRR